MYIEKFSRTTFLKNTSGCCFLLFIVNICCFKFQINKCVLLIEMVMKFGLDKTMPRPTTIHHHRPPPTTIQNISTTTHHQPKYVHQHPPPAKVHPRPPTTSQNISTTTYHFPKNGPPPRKSQNILIYNLF